MAHCTEKACPYPADGDSALCALHLVDLIFPESLTDRGIDERTEEYREDRIVGIYGASSPVVWEIRRGRKIKRLCLSCDRPCLSRWCRRCAPKIKKLKDAEYSQRIYRLRHSAGVCVECRSRLTSPLTKCPRCMQKSVARNGASRQRLVLAGLCRYCRQSINRPGIYCARCLVTARRANRAACKRLHDRRRANGLCIHCGGQPEQGLRDCRLCREKANDRRRLRPRENALPFSNVARGARLCGPGNKIPGPAFS